MFAINSRCWKLNFKGLSSYPEANYLCLKRHCFLKDKPYDTDAQGRGKLVRDTTPVIRCQVHNVAEINGGL